MPATSLYYIWEGLVMGLGYVFKRVEKDKNVSSVDIKKIK